jgi:hypothetical protein
MEEKDRKKEGAEYIYFIYSSLQMPMVWSSVSNTYFRNGHTMWVQIPDTF